MLSATSDNCGASVTVSGSCGIPAAVTKTAAAEKAVTLSNCCMVVSDGIPTTSCGRFEGDDGAGDNESDGGNGIICDSNNGIIPMESTPSSSSSTSSSSGLGPAGVIPGAHTAGKEAKEDLGPVPRDRCNTWPMRRPQLDINAQTSPLIHEQIPEEETDLCDNVEKLSNGRLGTSSTVALMGSPESSSFSPGISSPVPCGAGSVGPIGASSTPSDASDSGIAASSKKSTTRRNAWGNMSYADLITQAIISSPEKRLTLSQVYEWMVQNVPYFRDKGDSNSSAGWKNSIRHNLSLHSRFMRIQNEGAGKSSWWVINPDAKPGRNSRRQRSATLETTTKVAMDKKRRGARKKVMEMRASAGGGTLHSAGSSLGSQASVLSRELYTGEEDSSNFGSFRSRTQSNLSMSGSSSRVSPSIIENYVDDRDFDNFDFPPFVEAASAMPHDILDRTNEMNLNQSDSPAFHRPMANPILNGTSAPASSSLIAHIKTEPSSSRTENNVQPPPSYHELDVVRGVQNIHNPLLRTHLIQNRIPNQHGVPYSSSYSAGSPASSNWMHSNVIPVSVHASISCAAQQSFSGNTAALPMDLENLALPDQPLMEVENMEAVIRHELSQSAGSQLSFDNI